MIKNLFAVLLAFLSGLAVAASPDEPPNTVRVKVMEPR